MNAYFEGIKDSFDDEDNLCIIRDSFRVLSFDALISGLLDISNGSGIYNSDYVNQIRVY